jgi:glycine/D-amino acid oxidase-like deaminating enzyme
VSVTKDMREEIASIRILNTETHSETDLPCTKVLIAAGAWSPQVFSTLFPRAKKKLPISSLAGHSLVLRSPRWRKEHQEMGCHAIFTTDEEGYSPEIFSRLGEEIYIAGLNSSSLALPDLATASVVDENAVNKLMRTSKRLLGVDDLKVEDLEVLRKGLCFRPVTNRGTPFLTRIPDNILSDVRIRGAGEGGVWLAAGHGPWGISLSLGSGKVMAEMIQGKPPSVDIRLGL